MIFCVQQRTYLFLYLSGFALIHNKDFLAQKLINRKIKKVFKSTQTIKVVVTSLNSTLIFYPQAKEISWKNILLTRCVPRDPPVGHVALFFKQNFLTLCLKTGFCSVVIMVYYGTPVKAKNFRHTWFSLHKKINICLHKKTTANALAPHSRTQKSIHALQHSMC